MANIPPPNYFEGFPNMTKDGWASNANSQFDLGWIDGLFKVANKSMNQLFGGYELYLNEDDLLDLDELNNFAEDGTGAIIYASVWLVAGAIFTIAGIIWCLCNKCICCCRSSFKGRGDDEMSKLQNTDPRFEPRYSQRKGKKFGKPSSVAIVVAVLMAIWLLSLLLMTLHTFGANEKTNKVIEEIEPDLNSALTDIEKYLEETLGQLKFALGESYGKFSGKVDEVLNTCTVLGCEVISVNVKTTLNETNANLTKTLDELTEAVNDVQTSSRDVKDKIDQQFEDNLTNANNGLYWLFMLFNILYLAVFGLVLVGTVLAVFAKQSGLKTAGYLLMRVAIVLMFIFGIFVVLQLVLMFALGGIMTEAVCPAIRRLEEAPTDTTPSVMVEPEAVRLFQNEEAGNYEVPSFGRIIRGCKNNKAAYETFELKGAVDIDVVIDEIKESFERIRAFIPASTTGNVSISHKLRVNATLFQQEELEQTINAILKQMGDYTEFIRDAVKEEVGRCEPAYNAMNATINLFCNKVASPVIAYWWILQFVAVVFLLIIVTAMVFERLHF